MKSLFETQVDIVHGKKPYYVYLLFKPDGTPFYVGKGKRNRISAHEAETRYFLNGRKWRGMNTLKLNTISKMWKSDQTVLYQIDSWHDTSESAGNREIELVKEYGKRILETGPLVNIRDGGDTLTEEDRKLIGERIRQYYIDHPEARELAGERIRQYYIDHPEAKDHLSEVLVNYCIENPDFIENLQRQKNEWIANNPDEHKKAERRRLEICSTDSHRAKVSGIMKDYFESNPDELERIKKQGKEFWEDNPEAREIVRQNNLKNNNAQNLVEWYASDDENVVQDRLLKYKSHSEYLLEWNKTEEGKKKTKKAAAKRNEKVRTEEHRNLMSNKTSEYIRNNPEEDRKRREKALQTKMPKIQQRQKILMEIQDALFVSGKIGKKYEYITAKIVYVWKKKGFINSDLEIIT